jgi:hypothetical protein
MYVLARTNYQHRFPVFRFPDFFQVATAASKGPKLLWCCLLAAVEQLRQGEAIGPKQNFGRISITNDPVTKFTHSFLYPISSCTIIPNLIFTNIQYLHWTLNIESSDQNSSLLSEREGSTGQNRFRLYFEMSPTYPNREST